MEDPSGSTQFQIHKVLDPVAPDNAVYVTLNTAKKP